MYVTGCGYSKGNRSSNVEKYFAEIKMMLGLKAQYYINLLLS